MSSMFRNADSFNADISNWDVSSVTSMSGMFMDAASFNADISGWDVSSVTTMHSTFRNADSFNRDISGWNVSGVTNMNGMFYLADAFEQNLGNWYIVLDSESIDGADRSVGRITAQNQFLETQNPRYDMGSGGDSDYFEIDGDVLKLKAAPTKSSYTVTMTSTGDFGTGNSRTFDISVTEGASSPPPASDLLGGNATDGSGVPETNNAPVVDAGADQTVQEGSTVTLSGTATDDDGDDLTYSWTHDSSLAITMSDGDTLSPSFTAPQVDSNATVTFTLIVSDGTDAASDSLDIAIANSNAAPVEPQVTPSDPRGIGEITLTSTQPGTIEITWDAPGEVPRDYRVAWAKVGENFLARSDLAGNAFPTSPGHTVTSLEEGEEYKVKVRARYNGGGPGDWSGVITITVAGTG